MTTRSKIEKALAEALAESDLAGPEDIVRGLAWLLERHHAETIGLRRVGCFQDGLESTTGKQAVSYADGLKNYAQATAAMHESIAVYRQSIDQRDSSEYHASRAAGIRGLARLLEKLLPVWEEEGQGLKAKGGDPSRAGLL